MWVFSAESCSYSELPKPTADQTRMVMANGVPVNA